MLEELIVLNGELSPKYDKYNNKYTVKINENVFKLLFEYVKDSEVEITVYGNNNLKEGENYIVLLVKKGDQKEYIYLNAVKEKDEKVIETFNTTTPLEVANSMPIYGGYLIATSCFLIIVLLYLVMFKRKKKS